WVLLPRINQPEAGGLTGLRVWMVKYFVIKEKGSEYRQCSLALSWPVSWLPLYRTIVGKRHHRQTSPLFLKILIKILKHRVDEFSPVENNGLRDKGRCWVSKGLFGTV